MDDDRSTDVESCAALSPYHLFMFLLGIYALLAMAAQTFFHLDSSTLQVLDRVDDGLCILFFVDFLVHLYLAPSKSRYLIWGWLDLLSSLPAIDAFRAARIARIIRILRAFRCIRSARFLATYLSQRRSDGAFFAAAMLSILLVLFSSIAMLQFETAPESNIRTAEDSLWWAFTTITTVGYGDRFPVTLEGRMIAGTLMLAGVGMFATFTGLIASLIITPSKKDAEQDSSLVELRNEIQEMRRLLDHARAKESVSADADFDRLRTGWDALPQAVRAGILAQLPGEERKAA